MRAGKLAAATYAAQWLLRYACPPELARSADTSNISSRGGDDINEEDQQWQGHDYSSELPGLGLSEPHRLKASSASGSRADCGNDKAQHQKEAAAIPDPGQDRGQGLSLGLEAAAVVVMAGDAPNDLDMLAVRGGNEGRYSGASGARKID